ncbi:MAG: glutathione S-transferase family protein [Myxococcales bacterium]
MILIGQFDSPFVRRVGIAMRLYGIPFEHRPWSVWGDADRLAAFNPLRRVPVLVLPDGTSLIESATILDELDQRVEPEQQLLPRSGPARRRGLRVISFATGLGDKAVSLVYEGVLRDRPSAVWSDRCRAQITDTLDLLESERRESMAPHWLGSQLSHADIAVACVLRFTTEALPGLLELERWPRLSADAAQLEALAVFQEISQPFKVTLKE